MLYARAPSDLTETSRRGNVLSLCALASMATVFLCETRAYFSTQLGTDLSLLESNNDGEQRLRLNFDVTMMDLPCEHAAVDVFSAAGGRRKDVTRDVVKRPVDADGVRAQYEARNWHQDDVELWDPAVTNAIGALHEDGEDAIGLTAESFPRVLEEYPYLFVHFYSDECASCRDLAPTWEVLGEVVADTSMDLVDEKDAAGGDYDYYTDDEYEAAVNRMAPVLVAKLNCSLYPDICQAQGVRAYPTMRVFVDGKAKADYNGHRTVMELVHFLRFVEADHRAPGEQKMQHVLDCKCRRSRASPRSSRLDRTSQIRPP